MESTSVDGSDVEQLRDILGPLVSRTRLRELLCQASGSVQRAVNLHFGAEDGSASAGWLDEQNAVALSLAQGPEASVQPSPGLSDPMRAARQSGAHTWQALTDVVELSSSNDSDSDTGKHGWQLCM